jgi:putative ABC transport system permease protein
VLLGFTLPSVIRLRGVSPLRVLRKDLSPIPLSAWFVYGSAIAIVIALMWFYTGSLILTLSVLGGAVLVFLLTLLLIALLFYLLEKGSTLLSLSMRAGLRNLLRRKEETLVQTLAFALTLMAMLVVIFIRTDLLNNWQQSLPEDAPNHFVINILPDKVPLFEDYLREEQLVSSKVYPMSRGRLIEINDVAVKQAVTKEEKDNESLNRELNLTWSDTVQEENKILSGTWWQEGEVSDFPEVSIESRLAKKLDIKIGDRLTFFTGRQNWQAEVKSIRAVKWESFRPNFYFVFNPNSIEHLPATYMTSFYLAPEQKTMLKNMVKAFPAITVFEMDAVLSQLKAIIRQVIIAIEYVLLFVLAAGLMVTLAAVQASLDERLQEGALMRTLGAHRNLIRRSQWSEFGSMGLIAGIVAVLGTELVSFLASHYLFQMDYSPLWWAWAFVPMAAALLLALLGAFSARKVLKKSPMLVLREGR